MDSVVCINPDVYLPFAPNCICNCRGSSIELARCSLQYVVKEIGNPGVSLASTSPIIKVSRECTGFEVQAALGLDDCQFSPILINS